MIDWLIDPSFPSPLSYTGGACVDSSNWQSGKFTCSDVTPAALSSTEIVSSDVTVSGATTNPNIGDLITISGSSSKLPAFSALELRGPSVWQVGGGVSCSAARRIMHIASSFLTNHP